ncbi:MAG TPA: response regulator [Cyclobacteriaceae bacterium]|jgi:CheY-like chemotaxis protein|nr:response regulator [Cyclobacteriaceae bacterium]
MKKQILVIDDDMAMRCLLQNMLSEKYDVSCADNGLEACYRLSADNIPDLIISDMCMPEMDGLELLKALGASGLYKNIPVIILSTLEDNHTRERCLGHGAIAYLSKPFEAQELMQTVSRPLVSKMFL